MNEAEVSAVRKALALLNEARKERELGNTDAMGFEAEARELLAALLRAQEHKEG